MGVKLFCQLLRIKGDILIVLKISWQRLVILGPEGDNLTALLFMCLIASSERYPWSVFLFLAFGCLAGFAKVGIV